MLNNKLYGYFKGSVLMKISSNKELLQEILMDDYYEEAYYQYNYLIFSDGYWFYDFDETLSLHDFWHCAKDKYFNSINSRLSYRVIKDLEDYYIE